MKIVHINSNLRYTSAPLRIMQATQKLGCESDILTFNSLVEEDNIHVLSRTFSEKVFNKLISKKEVKRKSKYEITVDFPFSYGESGIDITREKCVQEADIIHFHWVCGQFIGYKSVEKLLKLGKPIVWTFHDSWPMTGGCHLRYDCEGFVTGCGCCPNLHSDDENDISKYVMKKKINAYKYDKFFTVSPSNWMYENVQKSLIFKNSKNYQIGNPLDFEVYKPVDVQKKDDRIVILFGAYSTLEEAKGYIHFKEALSILKNKFDKDKIVIKVFGTEEYDIHELEGFEVQVQGYIRSFEKMTELYSEADVYVFPSLIDNLPGTVMESLACETPVVCFDKNGTPELVLHKEDGYIAKAEDSGDLADGIEWILNNNESNQLGKKGREDMYSRYNEEVIAREYINLYSNILKTNY